MEENENLPAGIFKILGNEVRLSILFYLIMQPDSLTLDDLARLLGKAKSTIHHHIGIMIDEKVVIVSSKEGSKIKYLNADMNLVEGSISKIVKINYEMVSNEQKLNDFQLLISTMHTLMQMAQNTISMALKHNSQVLKSEKLGELKNLSELMNFHPYSIQANFFTEDQYFKYINGLIELDKKIKAETDNDQNKPYLVFNLGLPIEKILSEKRNPSET
jgi:DNA-binding transcriptional ArsR family regulator